MLVLKKLGYYDEYKENKIYSEDGFNPSAVPGGFDKNQLPKNLDVLRDNDWVFVSLLVKIVDKYGSESMSDFLAKAASDAKNGMRLDSDDERAQYMVLNLSTAYGYDFSAIFENWKIPVSKQTKAKLAKLPKAEL